MPYPSFSDPDYDLAIDIEPSLIGQPHTVFLDGDGEVVHVKRPRCYRSRCRCRCALTRFEPGTSISEMIAARVPESAST